jgi:hypothetical protein
MMIKSPVLIIGCPRAGTTLLYNILSEIPSLWSIGIESKDIIEYYHHPREKQWISGELSAKDITPTSKNYILTSYKSQAVPGTYWKKINQLRRMLSNNLFYRSLKLHGKSNSKGSKYSYSIPGRGLDLVRKLGRIYIKIVNKSRKDEFRLLEKTPENCLRIPFLLELFPDASIIYIIRDGRSNINSLMQGWKQPYAFPGYQVPVKIDIPGDIRGRWAFTLIPGWQDLISSPLEEVCAWQWIQCNQAVLDHKESNSDSIPYLIIRYEDLIYFPKKLLGQIADFIEVDFNIFNQISELPAINIISQPEPDKWKIENKEAIERVIPIIEPMSNKLGYKI